MNDFASFDTPGGPGGASIVERKDFQAKRPLCYIRAYCPNIHIYCAPVLTYSNGNGMTKEQNNFTDYKFDP